MHINLTLFIKKIRLIIQKRHVLIFIYIHQNCLNIIFLTIYKRKSCLGTFEKQLYYCIKII